MLRHFLQFLMMVMLIPVSAMADVRIRTTDSLIHTSGGEIVGMTLLIENNNEQDLIGLLDYLLPEGIHLLSTRSNDSIRVEAGSRRFIPMKFQISPDAPSGIFTLKIALADQKKRIQASTTTRIQIAEKRAVRLQVLNTLELMRHENDSIKANILLRNTGNTDETIQLVSSIPTMYGSRRFQRMLLYLEAGKDTLIHLGFIADRELFHMNQFNINITGLYNDQEVFGNSSLSVQNASSSRSFDMTGDYGFNWDQRANRITLSGRNPFSDNQSLYLDANLLLATSRGQLELNSNLYQWGPWNSVPVLTNTYLTYTQDKLGLTLGNITESAEKYINGRGARVNYLDTEDNYYFTAGMADKSYDLLNHYGRMGIGTGYAVFTRFQSGGFKPEEGKRYSGTFLYDRDPIENAESLIHASSIPLVKPGKTGRTSLTLDLGLGLGRALTDTLQKFSTEPSFALGTVFVSEIGKFYLSSNNYYSSGYYPGNRRGTLNLNQRLGLRLGMTNLWLGYNHFNFDPRSFIEHQARYQLLTERMDLGAMWGLSPFATLSVIPNRVREKSVYPDFFNQLTGQTWELVSYRLESVLNLRSRDNRHTVNLSLEGGFREEDKALSEESGAQSAGRVATGNRSLYRGNLSYNFWKINLNAHYQQGGFSVYELINSSQSNTDQIYRMGASLNFNYLSNKLFRSYLGLQYYKDSFSGTNYAANARSEISIGSKTAIFGQIHAYRYARPSFGSQQTLNFQLGFTQSLAGNNGNNKAKNGDLTIFTYYDHNNNGIYDQGDEKAVDKSILINNMLFLADAGGTITYRKVPYGQYTIRLPMEKGWYAPDRVHSLQQKSDRIEIPLQKSGTISGKIVFNFDPRLSLEVNTGLEGYTVTAINQHGYTAQTRTDGSGSFLLFLPEGEYTISLHEHEFPVNVYTEIREQHIVLEPGKINELPPFELKVRERKIEVKRFGSAP